MKDLITLLQKKSLKATSQRVAMLEIIAKSGHISTQNLHEELQKNHPSISLNTVYLNINILLKNNILTTISIDGNKAQYELLKEEHIHLICKECATLQDIKAPKDISMQLAMDNDFIQHKTVINIYGICLKCQQSRS